MVRIEIRSVGPIKKVNFVLNKVNVFIGQQSSGKSTIAKIISHCTWVEKDIVTSQSYNKYNNTIHFKRTLERHHKLNGYFSANSYISYKSNVIEIEYKVGKCFVNWNNRFDYKKSKISYIPAERNMVTLPEGRNVGLTYTSIRDFLFDWYFARVNYDVNNKLSLLKLGIKYYYDARSDKDYITHQNGVSYNISLSTASSGLQSITPLICMIDYLANQIYKQEEPIDFELSDRKRLVYKMLFEEFILKKYYNKDFNKNDRNKIRKQKKEIMEKISKNDDKRLYNMFNDLDRKIEMFFSTQNTQLIVEEPEQNLFPKTQRDLIYYMLEKCLYREDNRLTITTHSPYILYALNNCMVGGKFSKSLKNEEKNKYSSQKAWIPPNKVSIFQIEKGTLSSIKDKKTEVIETFFNKTLDRTGTIKQNYFDKIMQEIGGEHDEIISHFILLERS